MAHLVRSRFKLRHTRPCKRCLYGRESLRHGLPIHASHRPSGPRRSTFTLAIRGSQPRGRPTACAAGQRGTAVRGCKSPSDVPGRHGSYNECVTTLCAPALMPGSVTSLCHVVQYVCPQTTNGRPTVLVCRVMVGRQSQNAGPGLAGIRRSLSHLVERCFVSLPYGGSRYVRVRATRLAR